MKTESPEKLNKLFLVGINKQRWLRSKCLTCAHFDGNLEKGTCLAFPNGIPERYIVSTNWEWADVHDEKVSGQNGNYVFSQSKRLEYCASDNYNSLFYPNCLDGEILCFHRWMISYCLTCKHLYGMKSATCKAFPKGIPQELWVSFNWRILPKHDSIIEGQTGDYLYEFHDLDDKEQMDLDLISNR